MHRIQLIRDLMPDAGIGVDVIASFPASLMLTFWKLITSAGAGCELSACVHL